MVLCDCALRGTFLQVMTSQEQKERKKIANDPQLKQRNKMPNNISWGLIQITLGKCLCKQLCLVAHYSQIEWLVKSFGCYFQGHITARFELKCPPPLFFGLNQITLDGEEWIPERYTSFNAEISESKT